MATQGERIAALEDTLGAIAAKLGVGDDATEDATEATPKGKPKSRKAKTEAKTKTVARDLNPETVEMVAPDGSDLTFEVRATVPTKRSDGEWGEGVSYNGARTLLLKPNGAAAKAMTADAIRALAAEQDDDGMTGAGMLAAAVSRVEQRAKIGAHIER